MGLGFEEEHARTITAPFHELHYLRSKLKGHASGQEAVSIKREALDKYGSYKHQFIDLCSRCDEVIRTIAKAWANE